jgi:hypothetical protein
MAKGSWMGVYGRDWSWIGMGSWGLGWCRGKGKQVCLVVDWVLVRLVRNAVSESSVSGVWSLNLPASRLFSWCAWWALLPSPAFFPALLGCCFGLSSGVGLASFPWIPWSYEVPSRGSECPAVFGVLGCCRSCRACPSLLPWIASWTVVGCFLWCFLGCLGLGLLSGSGTKDRSLVNGGWMEGRGKKKGVRTGFEAVGFGGHGNSRNGCVGAVDLRFVWLVFGV